MPVDYLPTVTGSSTEPAEIRRPAPGMIRGRPQAVVPRLFDEEQDADGADDQPCRRQLAQDVRGHELPDLVPEIAAAHLRLPAEIGQLIVLSYVAVYGRSSARRFGHASAVREVRQPSKDGRKPTTAVTVITGRRLSYRAFYSSGSPVGDRDERDHPPRPRCPARS